MENEENTQLLKRRCLHTCKYRCRIDQEYVFEWRKNLKEPTLHCFSVFKVNVQTSDRYKLARSGH